jgi:hypothetical protein
MLLDLRQAPLAYPGPAGTTSVLVLPGCVHVLRSRGAPSTRERNPVVAVGSNASPAVLRHRALRTGMRPAVPLVRGRLANVRVGVSAHVPTPGFPPAAPAHADGESCRVAVSRRGVLGDGRGPLRLDRQEALTGWLAAQGVDPWTRKGAAASALLLATSARLREDVRQRLARRGLVRPCGIRAEPARARAGRG